jgi:serine/threonine protein kinase
VTEACPLSVEDIDEWRSREEDRAVDLIDWLVAHNRLDRRIAQILTLLQREAIDLNEAGAALQVFQDQVRWAEREAEHEAETRPRAESNSEGLDRATPKRAALQGEEDEATALLRASRANWTPSWETDPFSITEVAGLDHLGRPGSSRLSETSWQKPGISPSRGTGHHEVLYGQNFGKYLVCTRIGKGAMGDILLAHHRLLGIPVALKVLSPTLATNAEFRERFLAEGRLAANIHHPSIVRVLDCDEREGWLYLVMEYIDGMSGQELLHSVGCMPERQALQAARRVAEGLQTAHDHGIIHRDVKPANVLFAKNGNVKLTDLGLARALAPRPDDTPVFENGAMVGTPLYMAPEQARGDNSHDHRADIYALGATLYHFLAGVPPFQDHSLSGLIEQHRQSPLTPLSRHGVRTTPRTSALVSWMLSKNPEERPTSCAELIAEIDVCLSVAGTGASVVSTLAAALLPSKRHSTPQEARTIGLKFQSLFARPTGAD